MASDSVNSTGDKLFDYLKMKFRIDSGCKVSCNIPNNTWKVRTLWLYSVYNHASTAAREAALAAVESFAVKSALHSNSVSLSL